MNDLMIYRYMALKIIMLNERRQIEWLYNVCFYLSKSPENANKFIMTESRSVVAWGRAWGKNGEQGVKGIFFGWSMTIIFIVIIV